MRDPNNIVDVVIDDRESSVLPIETLPDYNTEDYDFMDEKDMKRYFDDVEKKIVRNSFEYRQMVKYLRENMDMNACSFYENVSNANSRLVKIHLHHEPITLYDMCVTIFNKRRFFHESLRAEMVSKEVMYAHYNLMVGLIPLAETVHELVHNQYIFVPTTKVFGRYKDFIKEYKDFLPDGLEDTLERIEDASVDCEANSDLLKSHYIYLDTTNAYNTPTKDNIEEMIKSRIQELKSGVKLDKAIIRDKPY